MVHGIGGKVRRLLLVCSLLEEAHMKPSATWWSHISQQHRARSDVPHLHSTSLFFSWICNSSNVVSTERNVTHCSLVFLQPYLSPCCLDCLHWLRAAVYRGSRQAAEWIHHWWSCPVSASQLCSVFSRKTALPLYFIVEKVKWKS